MISASLFRTLAKKSAPPAPEPAKEALAETLPGGSTEPAAAPPTAVAMDAGVTDDAGARSAAPSAPPRAPSRLIDRPSLKPTPVKARLSGAILKMETWGKPAAAATIALGIGALGYAGGVTFSRATDKNDVSALRWSEAAANIRDNREETSRIASEMRFMRVAIDSLKSDRSRNDLAGKQAQTTEKVDRLNGEVSSKVAKLSEQLDRIEKAQRDPARVTALLERLDKIDKGMQTATAPTPPPKPVAAAAPVPADVTQTGSITELRPPAKPVETDHRKVQVEGFVLRDIDDGLALIEARNGRLFEVSPGMNLPGVGKVEAIERRGRQWVVVTPKGYIGER